MKKHSNIKSNWHKCIFGAMATASLVSVAHAAYGPPPAPAPQTVNAIPTVAGFTYTECAKEGKVCKVPAGATSVFVIYGAGNKFATAQGTGDFTCSAKDLGVTDPDNKSPNKACHISATVPSATKVTTTTTTSATLTEADLKTLTAATVPKYTLDQYNNFRDKISLVPPAAVPGFTDIQINALGWGFDNNQLLALSDSQLSKLQRDWLTGIAKAKLLVLLPKLPPDQLYAVLSRRGLLTVAEVQTLPPDKLKSLAADQFGSLPEQLHKGLTPAQAAALTPAQVQAAWNNWSGPQLGSLTPAQLAGLPPSLMPGFASLLSKYSAEQIQALSGAQLSGNPVMLSYPWFKDVLPKMTAAQISGLSPVAAANLQKTAANVGVLSDDQAAALRLVLNPPPAGAKVLPGDSEEVKRQRGLLANCANDIEYARGQADGFKSDLRTQKIKGLVESAEMAQDYQAALTKYNAYRTKTYPPTQGYNGFSSDQLTDCSGALNGFKNYNRAANNINIPVTLAYNASQATLSPEQASIKPQLETCLASLKKLQTDNNVANEASKNIYNTPNRTSLLTTWGGVNDRINDFLSTNSFKYTADNLAACQKLAADTTVNDQYVKVAGASAQGKRDDVAAAKKAEDARVAAITKKGEDEQKALQAKYAAEEKAKADADAADRDPRKLKACIDDVTARYKAVGERYFAQPASFSANNRSSWDRLTKQVDSEISALTNAKDARVSTCLAPWVALTQLEGLTVQVEAQAAAARAKEEAEALKAREAKIADAAKQRADFLAANPTNIPGACTKGCTFRYGSESSKIPECERLCAIASRAVAASVDYIVDKTVVSALDEGLGTLGVTKALCEAANTKVGEILATVQKPIDSLKDKIKESSQEACISAKGSAARCNFVGRFVKTVADARACTDTAGSLKNSLNLTSAKVAEKKRLVDKFKSGKVDKSDGKAIHDAAMEVGAESAATCEAPTASALIKTLMAPCVDAAAGALWLGTHGGDL